ncbi:MAG: Rossmann-like and DUF2520 domain-containing protein [Spirosomataceae bacterium]
MRVSLIGAGNVAWHLSRALEDVGHGVQEVYSRNLKHAKELAQQCYDARAQDDLNFADSEAELFVLCVADDAFSEVLEQLVLPESAILVHTSGSKSLEELQHWASIYSDVEVHTGVFYPLQTFSKDTYITFDNIPLCIEASDAETEATLVTLGQEISSIVYLVNTAERQVLHVAAVFACNFTNHLWAITKDLLDRSQLEMLLIKPLIEETVKKALAAEHPANVQTGPARRGDQQTIQKHLQFLQSDWNTAKIYQVITDSILKRYDMY